MDTLSAMARGQAALAAGAKHMVFDWDKAAALIRDRKPERAGAGLAGDWEYTGGTIFADGQPVTDSYTYLSSNWAEPLLNLDGEDIECWRYAEEAPGWSSETKWPVSALKILRGEP